MFVEDLQQARAYYGENQVVGMTRQIAKAMQLPVEYIADFALAFVLGIAFQWLIRRGFREAM